MVGLVLATTTRGRPDHRDRRDHGTVRRRGATGTASDDKPELGLVDAAGVPALATAAARPSSNSGTTIVYPVLGGRPAWSRASTSSGM